MLSAEGFGANCHGELTPTEVHGRKATEIIAGVESAVNAEHLADLYILYLYLYLYKIKWAFIGSDFRLAGSRYFHSVESAVR